MAATKHPQSEHEATVRRIAEEAWNQQNLDVIEETVATECVAYFPSAESIHGPEEYRQHVQQYHNGFPDFHVEINDILSNEDGVAAQYTVTGTNEGPMEGGVMDLPATGNTVEVDGVVMLRFNNDGKLVEEHNYSDSFSMLEQLGLFG